MTKPYSDNITPETKDEQIAKAILEVGHDRTNYSRREVNALVCKAVKFYLEHFFVGKQRYTLEVMRKADKGFYGSDKYDYQTEQDARTAMEGQFVNNFCILTEWAQSEDGIGDYEVEIARQNW